MSTGRTFSPRSVQFCPKCSTVPKYRQACEVFKSAGKDIPAGRQQHIQRIQKRKEHSRPTWGLDNRQHMYGGVYRHTYTTLVWRGGMQGQGGVFKFRS